MLVSTVAGSTPHASARSRACSWSSASRSTCPWTGSSACRPAAARMPTWRIPPPSRLRRTRAWAIASADPASSEPTGAPSPLDRQTRHDVGDRAVLRERRPGRDVRVPEPGTVEVHPRRRRRRRTRAGRAGPGAAAPLRRRSCGCSRPRSPRSARRRAPCPARTSRVTAARSTCPRGCVQVRMVSPPMAACAPSSARAMCAEDSQSTSWPGCDERADRQDVGHRAGRGEQGRLVAEQSRRPAPRARGPSGPRRRRRRRPRRGPSRRASPRSASSGCRAEVDHRTPTVGRASRACGCRARADRARRSRAAAELERQALRSISATRNASSSDCTRLRRGSQTDS